LRFGYLAELLLAGTRKVSRMFAVRRFMCLCHRVPRVQQRSRNQRLSAGSST